MPRNRHKSPEEKVLLNLKKHIKKGDTVICAVSGGADSVFFLNMLVEFGKKTPVKIIVMHVNHCLRGPDAELDAKFVQNLAKNLDLKFESTKVDVEALAKAKKSSIEEIGREIRYKFGLDLFKKYKATYFITAHHADDNLETVLLNFIRGGGLKGLSGMKMTETKKSGLKLLRPIINISKTEISEYIERNMMKFRTDLTNFDTDIPRNFLRHEIIPKLKELNPNLQTTVLKNSSIYREIQDYLMGEAEKWINSINLSEKTEDLSTFDLKTMQSLPIPIKKEVLRLIYKQRTGDTKDITSAHIEEVLSLIDKNTGGKRKKFGKYTVEIRKGTFILK